jgi:hypothetical protein
VLQAVYNVKLQLRLPKATRMQSHSPKIVLTLKHTVTSEIVLMGLVAIYLPLP